MTIIETAWYYPDSSGGPKPCEWVIVGWPMPTTCDLDVIRVYLA